MTVLDYIFIGCAAVAVAVGAWKGLLKQLFALVGIFVVAVGTTYLAPYPAQWLSSVIEGDGLRSIVAMIITFVVLALAYGIVTAIISKIVNKGKVLGALNRVLGAVLAVGVVYLVFAVLCSLLLDTADDFLPRIKGLMQQSFRESWVMQNVYANNFFGNWLLGVLAEKIPSIVPAA